MSDLPTVRPGGYPLFPAAIDRALALFPRVELTPDALQLRADKVTGLRDPAPEEVIEPLARLCADFAAAPPTRLGALMAGASLTEALANRRRIPAAMARRHPPAARRPIVIVGWHRTGTTFLHDLLGAVPGLGFVPLYRLLTPVARWDGLLRALAVTRLAWAIAPEMPVLHPQSVRGPEECWIATMPSLRVEGFALHWNVASYAEWLATCDQRPYASIYARALALFTADLGTRLVMKDAAHLNALPALLEAQPDACFVWTHRDPAACVGSFASLSAVHHRTMYGVYDPTRAGRVCVDRMVTTMDRALADRAAIPPGQLVDVTYDALVADPLGVVSNICAAYDVPFDSSARDAVAARLKPKEKRAPAHRYTLEQWGLDAGAVRARFTGYPDRFWRG